MDTIPGISKWNTYAGGTSAAPEKHGYYDIRGPFGLFTIDPISTQYGRHRGYKLSFANEKGLILEGIHGGLWHDLGMYRSPQLAATAARKFYETYLSGISKNPVDVEDWHEVAYDLIDSELNNFDQDPKGFIKSMGWPMEKFKNISKLKGEISITSSETDRLAKMLETGESEDLEDAIYSDLTSDYVTNLIAQKILSAYRKLK